jgi:hypothetical protein
MMLSVKLLIYHSVGLAISRYFELEEQVYSSPDATPVEKLVAYHGDGDI